MKRNRLGEYGCAAGLILLCAVFVCMGREMLVQDAGILELRTWSVEMEGFRTFRLTESENKKLEHLSKLSGQKKEKLLAALMLKYHFTPPEVFSEASLLADMLGYEKLDDKQFAKITDVYRRMLNAVEYLPAAALDQADGKQTGSMKDIEICEGTEYETILKAKHQEKAYFPVVSMMSGKLAACQTEDRKMNADKKTAAENRITSICIESAEGIRIQYENMDFLQNEWQEEKQVRAGEVIGFAGKEGVRLRFWVQAGDGSWYSYQGRSGILCGEGKIQRIKKSE